MIMHDIQQKSFVDPVSNLTVLSSIDLTRDIVNLIQLKFPEMALPAFLHEITHHWCFLSPVGSVLSLLSLRAYRSAILIAASQSKEVADILRYSMGEIQISPPFQGYSVADFQKDMIRYETALNILRPLAEGMALFAEYDATPDLSAEGVALLGGEEASYDEVSDIISIPMEWAVICFSRNQASDKEIEHLILERFLMLLYRMRLSENFSTKRDSLLVRPLAYKDGGYLPGYLTVKNLWNAGRQYCKKLTDSDLFLTYIRNYFYNDFGFVAAILEPDIELSWIADSITWYFRKRVENFLNSDLSLEISLFEEKSKRKSELYEQIEGIAVDHALSLIGRKRFKKLLSEINDTEASSNELDTILCTRSMWMFAQREIMCIGSFAVDVNVNENRYVQATVNGKLIYSAPALKDVSIGKGKGSLEINLSHAGHFIAMSVSREGYVVSNIFLGDVTEQVRQQFENYLIDCPRQDSEAQIDKDMIDTASETDHLQGNINYIREMFLYAHNELYKQWATWHVAEDCRKNCIEKMEEEGFWGLFEQNSDAIRGLAILGLTTSFRMDKDRVKKVFSAQNLDFEATVASIRSFENKSQFRCLVEREDEIFCLV
jgi:hypothetical protein